VPKKMLWKMGTCSRLSERLLGDGRDSAVRRVVSDTDTPKVLPQKEGHKKNRPLCAPPICLIEPFDVAEVLTVRQVCILGIHAVCNLE